MPNVSMNISVHRHPMLQLEGRLEDLGGCDVNKEKEEEDKEKSGYLILSPSYMMCFRVVVLSDLLHNFMG
ncbi:hypothetical protein H920_10677 [Fukomys damarensis]|uniref:Uncharacterized protein n=1 Tax=Fukomys damarensis TaxID=885580 RepID=A0A091DBN9_FUKDA|nr:hypothetical protein H920_10677 [Fukomys damarensis]